jgi:preprotein translocase subunit SecG
MTFVLDVVQVFISIMLVFLILMHSGRDTGLSGFGMGGGGGAGPFGGGGGGGSLVERNLNRWTILFALLFVINTIVLIKIS